MAMSAAAKRTNVSFFSPFQDGDGCESATVTCTICSLFAGPVTTGSKPHSVCEVRLTGRSVHMWLNIRTSDVCVCIPTDSLLNVKAMIQCMNIIHAFIT